MNKGEIRELYLQKRLTLSPSKLETFSEQICHTAFSKFQLEKKKISLFLPIERKREINTYKIWEKAISFDALVAVPKINPKTNELKQILFETVDQLEISNFGIPEPNRGRTIAAEHFDYVFVPLLAIDSKGNRVGYGKGFYDNFLGNCNQEVLKIGLSLFDIESSIDDIHEKDIALDICVTPSSIYYFK